MSSRASKTPKILFPKGRPSRPVREIRAAIRKVAAEAAAAEKAATSLPVPRKAEKTAKTSAR
jgi:hypothetical protein